MSKRWTKVEIAYLEKHAEDKSLAELAKRFRTDAATVEAKLKELRRKAAPVAAASDDGVAQYQAGMKALYGGDWKKAIELFEAAAADAMPELAARAHQFAAVARQRLTEVEPEDPWVKAVYEKNRGALDEALAICLAGKRAEKDGRFAYLAAVVCALRGDVEKGREHLARAVELDPRNRAHALHDPDLKALHEQAG